MRCPAVRFLFRFRLYDLRELCGESVLQKTELFLVMMRVGVFRSFFQLTVCRHEMLQRFFRVPTELLMIVGASGFGFLPRFGDVSLR